MIRFDIAWAAALLFLMGAGCGWALANIVRLSPTIPLPLHHGAICISF